MSNNMIYADGIANISIIEGVVRFDLVGFAPTNADPKAIKAVGTVAMSVQGLLRTHGQLNDLVNKLIEQGVLKKAELGAVGPQGGQLSSDVPDYSVR
jgi:hypothetical protein